MKRPNPAADRSSSNLRPLGVALALGCFTGAFLMLGGVCYLVLDWPAADAQGAAMALGTLAAAIAFLGFGVLVFTRPSFRQLLDGGRSTEAVEIDPLEQHLDTLGLTDKEHDVALLILQHRSYSDIAEACGISPRTVQFHASNLFHKAAVARRRDFERLMREDPSSVVAHTASPGSEEPAGHKSGRSRTPATPPCSFPECAVCQRTDRMACLRNPPAPKSSPAFGRRHLSSRQPKGNGW